MKFCAPARAENCFKPRYTAFAPHLTAAVTLSRLPAGANISKFLMDVAELVESKKTNDVVDISNQSSKEGIRIVIELKRDADVDHFINML